VPEIASRLVSFCANRIVDSTRGIDEFTIDLGALIRRLILFDKYILDSIRFKEFPYFIRTFGYNGTIALLESGLVDIAYGIDKSPANLGQHAELRLSRGKPVLPLGSYSFWYLSHFNEEILHDSIGNLHTIEGLTTRQRNRLEDAVLASLLHPPDNAGELAISYFQDDARSNAPIIALAVAQVLSARLGTTINPEDLSIRVHEIARGDYRVDSNLMQRFGLDRRSMHAVIERALLAVARVNQRFEEMNRYSALSGSRPGDLPLFVGKFKFAVEHYSSEGQEAEFQRLITVNSLPDLDPQEPEQYVDIPRLIAITQTDECREFRHWLKTVHGAADEEIERQYRPLRDKLGAAIRSGSGRAVRFLTTTGIGLIPGAGVAGVALSAFDTFVLEKVISQPGPVSFISRLYPSIFE
jgi:hypothetical protein